jgi:hypothetical protein
MGGGEEEGRAQSARESSDSTGVVTMGSGIFYFPQ